MGYSTYIPSSDNLVKREKDHDRLFNAIHRARVSAVNILEGTVKVILERVDYSDTITIPLLGLSVPSTSSGGDTTLTSNFKQASWGRYIPQVGDLLLVGFDSAGSLHALGYASIFYKGFTIADVDQEAKGGFGWGSTSGKTVKPGDWDFKSARDSSIYLGDKAVISSGPYSIAIDKPGGNITISTPLLRGSIGNSQTYAGVAKRRLFVADPEESYIRTPRMSPTSILPEIAQEFAIKAKWAGGPPLGQPLVTWSIGDVIDDEAPVPTLALSSTLNPLRFYFSSTDITGYLPAFKESVDTLGNYECTSILGTDFAWTTLLSTWEIRNLKFNVTSLESISHTSTTSFDVVAGTEVNLTSGTKVKAFAGTEIDLSGSASAALYSPIGMTSLGGPAGAGFPLILSPAMTAAMAQLATAVAAVSATATTELATYTTTMTVTVGPTLVGPLAPTVAGFTAVSGMLGSLVASLGSLSSAAAALSAAIALPTASTAKTLAV